MNKNFELMLVYHIYKLKRLYRDKTKNFKAELGILTEKDGKELERISKKYIYSLNKLSKKLLHDKLEKVATAEFKSSLESLFDFFNFKENEIKKLVEKKIEKFKKEDVLIRINETEENVIKELYNDSTIKALMKNESMLKMVNLFYQYNDYAKETVIMFNREASLYMESLLSLLDFDFDIKQLLQEILKNTKNNEKLIEDISELRARRNILEHNDGMIDDEYIKRVKSVSEKDIGKVIITAPDYITENYKNLIAFYTLATCIVAKKLGEKLDGDILSDIFKRTRKLTSEIQMIKYFEF